MNASEPLPVSENPSGDGAGEAGCSLADGTGLGGLGLAIGEATVCGAGDASGAAMEGDADTAASMAACAERA